jgi:hypothetical protein
MVLTHPAINLDLYPYHSCMFSSLEKAPDLSQMKSERFDGAVILVEAQGVLSGADLWTDLSCNGNCF